MRYLKKLFGAKQGKSTSLRVSGSSEKNRKLLEQEVFVDDDSIIYREFATAEPHSRRCLLVFSEGMADRHLLSEYVVAPLMESSVPAGYTSKQLLNHITETVVETNGMAIKDLVPEIAEEILAGDCALFVDGCSQAMIINSKFWVFRGVAEPVAESVVRGPREGFSESFDVNLSLLRRRIRTPMLKFKYHKLGTQTHTKVAITYIEGVASPAIVKEVEERLNKINIDGILESGYIEELIQDSPLSPFKTIGHTERPDVVAAKLLEGRVAIIVDGTPFVLTMPFIFVESLQANEDYFKHFAIASLDRLVRYICLMLSTITPAVYLALVSYHLELIPTELALSISVARQGVPFPVVVEVMVMGLVFEILREGGVRLPTPIGQALSIVGAIVLGDAAVSAQIVSAPMIIVVAMTAISGFAVPKLYGVSILLRAMLTLLASVLGLYGVFFGLIAITLHLVSLRSFGVPYMETFTISELQSMKDTAIRAPWWLMRTRPHMIGKENPQRLTREVKK